MSLMFLHKDRISVVRQSRSFPSPLPSSLADSIKDWLSGNNYLVRGDGDEGEGYEQDVDEEQAEVGVAEISGYKQGVHVNFQPEVRVMVNPQRKRVTIIHYAKRLLGSSVMASMFSGGLTDLVGLTTLEDFKSKQLGFIESFWAHVKRCRQEFIEKLPRPSKSEPCTQTHNPTQPAAGWQPIQPVPYCSYPSQPHLQAPFQGMQAYPSSPASPPLVVHNPYTQTSSPNCQPANVQYQQLPYHQPPIQQVPYPYYPPINHNYQPLYQQLPHNPAQQSYY